MIRVAVIALVAAAACAPPSPERAPVQLALPRDAFPPFLDAPWPSDLHVRDVDGRRRIDVGSFPNPTGSTALDELLVYARDSLDGWRVEGGMFFRVEGGVDPASLPADPAASIGDGASMFLVALDAPTRRLPIEIQLVEQPTSYLPAGTVVALPLLGVVADGPTALVVTSRARRRDGVPLGPSPDLRKLLSCEPIEDVDDPPPCAPYQKLAADLGLAVDDVALVQIVTPFDPTAGLRAAYRALRDAPAPAIEGVALRADAHTLYDAYEGVVHLAQYQAGAPPFDVSDGVQGGFVLDDDGVPIVQRTEPVRFLLTVPKGEPPADGWPVCVMGHGTGGTFESGLGDGPSSEAHQLASSGWAMLAVSEPLHATRAGNRPGDEDVLTFNFYNPIAGRDNWRQSTLEKVQLTTLARDLYVEDGGGKAIPFDRRRTSYFGHSQGGIVGGIFVGVEERVDGAFLSGAGAGFAPSLIEKTEPVVIADVMRTVLGVPDDEPLDRFHPVLSLLQTFVAPVDPLYYGDAWRALADPPHLVATSGLFDDYTPKRNHGALAASFGLPLVQPVAEEVLVLDLLGVDVDASPAQANLELPSGARVTAGLFQFPSEGHFAVFQDPDAQRLVRRFFETLPAGAPVARGR